MLNKVLQNRYVSTARSMMSSQFDCRFSGRFCVKLFGTTHCLALIFMLFSAKLFADDHQGASPMEKEEVKNTTVPAAMQDYLAGASSDAHHQFDFLIGDWDVSAVKYGPDGEAILYTATWSAKSINDGRMIVDDFKAITPTGMDVSSYVTLRSYSPLTQRWEFAGLAAHQPSAAILEWYGVAEEGAMVLHATGVGPDGKKMKNRIRFFDISGGAFSWESHLSFDDGKNWVKNGELKAVRQG